MSCVSATTPFLQPTYQHGCAPYDDSSSPSYDQETYPLSQRNDIDYRYPLKTPNEFCFDSSDNTFGHSVLISHASLIEPLLSGTTLKENFEPENPSQLTSPNVLCKINAEKTSRNAKSTVFSLIMTSTETSLSSFLKSEKLETVSSNGKKSKMTKKDKQLVNKVLDLKPQIQIEATVIPDEGISASEFLNSVQKKQFLTKKKGSQIQERFEREAYFKSVKEHKQQCTDDLVATANSIKPDATFVSAQVQKRERRVAAAKARKEYYARHTEKRKKYGLKGPMCSIDLNRRVIAYHKHHKCDCGLRHNTVYYTDRAAFNCNHGRSIYIGTRDVACGRCGKKRTRFHTTPCGCEYGFCSRCKTSTYRYTNADVSYVQFFDKHVDHTGSVIYSGSGDDVYDNDFEIVCARFENSYRPIISRENFFRECQGLAPKSYAECLKGKAVPTAKVVYTDPYVTLSGRLPSPRYPVGFHKEWDEAEFGDSFKFLIDISLLKTISEVFDEILSVPEPSNENEFYSYSYYCDELIEHALKLHEECFDSFVIYETDRDVMKIAIADFISKFRLDGLSRLLNKGYGSIILDLEAEADYYLDRNLDDEAAVFAQEITRVRRENASIVLFYLPRMYQEDYRTFRFPISDFVNDFRSDKRSDDSMTSLPATSELSSSNMISPIHTIPEGSTISAITSPIKAASNSVQTELKKRWKAIKKAITDAINKLVTACVTSTIVSLLKEFLAAARKLFKIIFAYCSAVSPANIAALLVAFKNEYSKTAIFLALTNVLRDVMFAEEIDLLKMPQVLLRIAYDDGPEEVKKIIYDELTVLAPAVYSAVKEARELNDRASFKHFMEEFIKHPECITITQTKDYVREQLFKRAPMEKPKKFWTKVKSFISTTPESSFTELCSMIMGLGALLPNKFMGGIKIISQFLQTTRPTLMSFVTLGHSIKMVKSLVDFLMDVLVGRLQNTKEWIAEEMQTKDSPFHELATLYLAYQHSCNKLEFVDESPEGKSLKECLDPNALRHELYATFARCDDYASQKGRLDGAYFDFKNKMNSALTVPPTASPRKFEPTTLVLSGGPGTGKSTFWSALVAGEVLTEEELKGDDPMRKIVEKSHTWNTGDTFQPGMSNKKIIVFDDFQQDRESTMEALAVIRLCSIAPFPIDSPNIHGPEIKGMTASPEFVVICTNISVDMAAQKLASTEALKRRYDLELEVHSRYNPEKPKEKIFTVRSCNRYKKLIGRKLDFDEAKALFTVVNRAKKSQFKKVKAMVNDLAKRAIVDLGASYNFALTPDLPQANSVWQADEDFMKDYERFVTTEPESGVIDQFKAIASTTLLVGCVYSGTYLVTYSMVAGMISLANFTSTALTNGMTTRAWLKSILQPLFRSVILAVGGVCALFAIYKISTHSSEESGGTRTSKNKGPRYTVPESGGYDAISKIIENATGFIYDRRSLNCTNVLFVGGHFILVPRHFFYNDEGEIDHSYREIELLKSTWNGLPRVFNFNSTRLIEIKGNMYSETTDVFCRQDLILYELDHSIFSAEKNIVKHFWDGSHSVKGMAVDKYDYVPYENGHYSGRFIVSRGVVTQERTSTLRREGKQTVYLNIGMASCSSRPASCGSAFRLLRQESPIIGIHIARAGSSDSNPESCFHYITRKALQDAMDTREIINLSPMFTIEESSVFPYLPDNATIYTVGKVSKPAFQPTRTDICKSLAYEACGPSITQPSVLSPYDSRLPIEFRGDNFYKQLFSGYTQLPGVPFPDDELDEAFDSLNEQFGRIQAKSFVPNRKLTLLEAINGLSWIPQNTRIDMSTSCGYPYVGEGLTKKDLFYEEDGVIYPTRRIIDDYNKAIKEIENGIVPFLPYTLSLKDERVKHAKITTPKTRIFSCSNVIHFLVMRTYFYSALFQFYHASISDSFCIPSLDRLSLDWHDLATYMLEAGPGGFDFDFKFWDRNIPKKVIVRAVRVLLRSQPISDLERKTLEEFISSSYAIFRDYLLLILSIMSGCLLTFLMNCLINEGLHRAAYLHLARKHSPYLASIPIYLKYVRGMRGGDDTITTADPRILEFYNGRTVAEYFKSHCLDVTSSDKSLNIAESTPFMDLSFLKNTTIYRDGYFLPKPELASLTESMYWIRLNKHQRDAKKATEDNVTAALRGVFFHGKKIFNDIRDKVLIKAPTLCLPTYSELYRVFTGYYRFPGAHADFASRVDQEDPFLNNAEPHEAIHRPVSQDQYITMITNTIPESGATDKSQIEMSQQPAIAISDTVGNVLPSDVSLANSNDPAKVATERIGTTIHDAPQKTLTAVSVGKTTVQSKNDRAAAYMNDPSWDLSMLSNKFTYIEDITWDITQITNTVLKRYNVPKDLIRTAAQKAPFLVTKLWKCKDIVLKIVLKASPFYAGCLGLGFYPLGDPVVSMDPNIMIPLGAQIVKVSQDESHEITIPFRHFYGYIDANDEAQTLGQFYIWVISPLRTGTGNANSISMSVYVAFEGNEFKLPDIVPAGSFHSYKLDKHQSMVVTLPESGRDLGSSKVKDGIKDSQFSQKAVEASVNDNIADMKATVLSNGPGTVARVRPQHYQDAPTCMNQLSKRWRTLGLYKLFVQANAERTITIPIVLLAPAIAPFWTYFAAYRGSLNVRIDSDADSMKGMLITVKGIGAGDTLSGSMVMDPLTTSVTVSVPWMHDTFIGSFTGFNTGLSDTDAIYINVINYTNTDKFFDFNIYGAVGDDWHYGIFRGTEGLPELIPLNITATGNLAFVRTEIESGILEEINTALDNTIPIVEKVSVLASLLDAHMITQQPAPVLMKTRPYTISTDVPQFVERLWTTNHNGMSLPDDQCFGVSTTETDIRRLVTETKTLSARYSWQQSHAAGHVLANIEVGPDIAITPGSLHGIFARMYKKWHGGIVFLFDIIASEMHRGQLLCAYSPRQSFSPAYADASQTYFTTLDLNSGRGTYAVICPYLCEKPYLDVEDGMGTLTLYVQTPLRSTSAVHPDVEIVMYTAFDHDIAFGLYGTDGFLTGPSTSSLVRTVMKKSK